MKKTVKKWIKGASKLLLAIVLTTVFFGLVETRQYSAYAVCRNVAMNVKGYAIWKHEHTYQFVFQSWVIFSDGVNDLTCYASGIGPFWVVNTYMQTLVGCRTDISNPKASYCPEGLFGVSP